MGIKGGIKGTVALAAALILAAGCANGSNPVPQVEAAPTTAEAQTERQPVSLAQSLAQQRGLQLHVDVPSCHGDPVVDTLEEDDEQVRIRVVTTMVVSGDAPACLDTITVDLQEPLGGRPVIDMVSGEPINTTS